MLLIIAVIVMAIVIYNKNEEIENLKNRISSLEAKLKSLSVMNIKSVPQNQVTKDVQETSKVVSPPQVNDVKSESVVMNQSDVIEEKSVSKNVVAADSVKAPKVNDAERVLKAEKRKNENRNNAILAVGASFIVIAALSFLYSTWYTVPNIVKSVVILVLAGVFLGLSRFAGNVLKLTKTARTFFYIAMAYIPLCLFSISLFGMAGEYFSITGEGSFIYLSLVSFIVMALYLYFAYKNKDRKLYISSNIMQLIFVICIGGIFVNTFKEFLTILLMYSAALNLFLPKLEKRFLKESKGYRDVLSYIFSGIGALVLIAENTGLVIDVFLALGVVLNLLIIYKNVKRFEVYGVLYGATLLLLSKVVNVDALAMPFLVKQIIVLLYVISSAYYHNFVIKDSKITKLVNIINLIVLAVLCFITKYTDVICIDALVLVSISILLSTIEYFKSKRADVIIFGISLVVNSVLILLPNSILNYEVSLVNYLVCKVFAIAMLFILHRDKHVNLKIIPLMLLFINLYRYELLIAEVINFTYVLSFVAIVLFAFLSIRDKSDIAYRCASFLFLIGLCIYVRMSVYVSLLLTTIWSLIQLLYTEGELKKAMKSLIIISLSFMYMIMLSQGDSNITLAAYMITIIESLLCWFIFSRSKGLKALPILGIMVPLYSYDLLALGKYDITFLINILMVVMLTYVSINFKKDIVYTLTSFLYLIGLILKYNEMNVYIKFALVIIWGVIHFMHTDGKIKDLMKVLILTCSYGVYINVVEDIGLYDITAINILGFFVYSCAIIRRILRNYIKQFKVFEYVVYTFAYLVAFTMYQDAIDLAIFIVMQVIILMVAYTKKIGPAFVITIPAILINMIYLTKNFWLSIPWWGYLVCVGGVLIVFAARNELSEKKDIKTVKEKLEKVKNYLDM